MPGPIPLDIANQDMLASGGGGDVLAQLLPMLMKSGAAAPGPDPGMLGKMAAFQNSDFMQGVPSRSGPIGQIAQAIMPFLQAKQYQAQAEQQHQEAMLGHWTDIIKLATTLDEHQIKRLQLQAKTNPDMAQVLNIVNAIKGDKGSLPPGTSVSLKAGPATIRMGGEKSQGGVLGLIGEAMPGATPEEKLKKWVEVQSKIAGAKTAATEAAKPLKPLASGESERISSGISAIDSIDKAITGFKSTTYKDILASTFSHGIFSNQALRDYNKYFNDIDNQRAGARGMTKAALDRIYNELPNPLMALKDPDGFIKALQSARANTYSRLTTDAALIGKSKAIDPTVLQKIQGMAPKGAKTPSMADQIRETYKQLKAKGHTQAEADQMIEQKFGIQSDTEIDDDSDADSQ